MRWNGIDYYTHHASRNFCHGDSLAAGTQKMELRSGGRSSTRGDGEYKSEQHGNVTSRDGFHVDSLRDFCSGVYRGL